MKPSRYGPFKFIPIKGRPALQWPNGARVALWVNPNVEFFGLDDVMPGNGNERVAREHAKVPNVRNWSLRDYGNRVGIWRLMEVLARYGVRATPALNSQVCDHHPEVIEAMLKAGWELMGHNETNAMRINEMPPDEERASIQRTLERIAKASGKAPTGWLGAGLAETWNTLEYLSQAGIRYVCDWVNDEQPYTMDVPAGKSGRRMVSLPYTLQCNDVPAYFDFKASVPEFEQMMRRQFDVLYRDSEQDGRISGRVMAIAVHPFVTGQPHRVVALERALEYICKQPGVWLATGSEIIEHYLKSDFSKTI